MKASEIVAGGTYRGRGNATRRVVTLEASWYGDEPIVTWIRVDANEDGRQAGGVCTLRSFYRWAEHAVAPEQETR